MADPEEAYLAREARARKRIDEQLVAAGWVVQSKDEIDVNAGPGVATREFPLDKPHGRVDYLLFLDGQPAGVIEAKPEGTTLVEVEHQSGKYVEGLPDWLNAPVYPLPFIYESTGTETRFTNGYDPDARSRGVFTFHRPETLAEWSWLGEDVHRGQHLLQADPARRSEADPVLGRSVEPGRTDEARVRQVRCPGHPAQVSG
jgi:type I restriction enzyme, R subunit